MLGITAPIFVLIALGFVAVRYRLLQPVDLSGFGRFVLLFALPALLFDALISRPLADQISWPYLLAYGGASLLAGLVGLGVLLLLRLNSKGVSPPLVRLVLASGTCWSNSAFVAYPILLLSFPTVAPAVLSMNLLIENLLLLPLFLVGAELASGQSHRQGAGAIVKGLRIAAERLAVSPVIWAVVAGLLWHVWTPDPLSMPWSLLLPGVAILGKASTALALFTIGGNLAALPPGRSWRPAVVVSSLKLILHPLAVALVVIWLIPLDDPQLRAAAIVAAAAPIFSVYPVLALRYQMESDASQALLVSTVGSFVSLSLVLYWLAPKG